MHTFVEQVCESNNSVGNELKWYITLFKCRRNSTARDHYNKFYISITIGLKKLCGS